MYNQKLLSSISPLPLKKTHKEANDFIHEFHLTLSQWQQGIDNKINLKTDEGWEWDFLSGTDNTM